MWLTFYIHSEFRIQMYITCASVFRVSALFIVDMYFFILAVSHRFQIDPCKHTNHDKIRQTVWIFFSCVKNFPNKFFICIYYRCINRTKKSRQKGPIMRMRKEKSSKLCAHYLIIHKLNICSIPNILDMKLFHYQYNSMLIINAGWIECNVPYLRSHLQKYLDEKRRRIIQPITITGTHFGWKHVLIAYRDSFTQSDGFHLFFIFIKPRKRIFFLME